MPHLRLNYGILTRYAQPRCPSTVRYFFHFHFRFPFVAFCYSRSRKRRARYHCWSSFRRLKTMKLFQVGCVLYRIRVKISGEYLKSNLKRSCRFAVLWKKSAAVFPIKPNFVSPSSSSFSQSFQRYCAILGSIANQFLLLRVAQCLTVVSGLEVDLKPWFLRGKSIPFISTIPNRKIQSKQFLLGSRTAVFHQVSTNCLRNLLSRD